MHVPSIIISWVYCSHVPIKERKYGKGEERDKDCSYLVKKMFVLPKLSEALLCGLLLWTAV